MAVVLPFVAYARLPAARPAHGADRARRVWRPGVGGYVGLNASALVAAIEFGIQPDLFHNGRRRAAVLAVPPVPDDPGDAAGPPGRGRRGRGRPDRRRVAYLQRANVPLLRINHPERPAMTPRAERRPQAAAGRSVALVGLGVMAVLTPLGLLAPGGAFGEDAPEDLDLAKYHLGAVPTGCTSTPASGTTRCSPGTGSTAALAIGTSSRRSSASWWSSPWCGAVAWLSSARDAAATGADVDGVGSPRAASAATGRPRARRVAAAVEVGLCPCGCIGDRRKGSFVEKTLAGGAGVMRQAHLQRRRRRAHAGCCSGSTRGSSSSTLIGAAGRGRVRAPRRRARWSPTPAP